MLGVVSMRAVLGLVIAVSLVGPFATAHVDGGSRTETKPYVVSPGHAIVVSDPALPAGLGAVRFGIEEGESRVSISVDDAASPWQDVEAWAVFTQEAPIVVSVNFCNALTRAVPSGATTLRVVVDDAVTEEGTDSACSGVHGATTGTVTATFS